MRDAPQLLPWPPEAPVQNRIPTHAVQFRLAHAAKGAGARGVQQARIPNAPPDRATRGPRDSYGAACAFRMSGSVALLRPDDEVNLTPALQQRSYVFPIPFKTNVRSISAGAARAGRLFCQDCGAIARRSG